MTDTTYTGRWPLPVDDPYPSLRELRERAPIHFFDELDGYLAVSHPLVAQLLFSDEWSSNPLLNPRLKRMLPGGDTGSDLHLKTVLFSDPPEHTRLRRSVSGWLSPRTIGGLRDRVGAIVDSALVEARDGQAFEVMEHLAYAVPQAVICEILGVPVDLVATRLREKIPSMLAVLDPLAERDAIEKGMVAGFELLLEIVPLVTERRTQSRPDDLISALMGGPDGDGDLTLDEAIMMALLLLAAGHETTATLIGNAIVALQEHPELAHFLRAHPDLVPDAVEELLRHESPVQVTWRVPRADVTVGDVVVRAGQEVLLSIGAANRDPAVFAEPDRLDVERGGRRHLAFGHGAHVCAGAAVARVEAQEVLQRLLALDPPIEERELRFTRAASPTLRGIETLWLG